VLQAQNIPFVTLKGICMSEWLYGDTGLRQMSDYGAPTSGTATHLLHLKALKNPIDFMRSRSNGMSTLSADRQVRYHTHREVVFQGKEFMVEKYGLKSKVEGQKSEEDGQGSEVEGNKIKESKVKGQKTLQIFKPFKFSNLESTPKSLSRQFLLINNLFKKSHIIG
jgi:hypothetical protein